ncbi:hypothetical protein [Kitasatospora purpeofusca]|uniref:hypothetical protein n=1 Tax=Kitasatospora purpeofusca TaxID=67352 RepID=UPI000ADBDCD6|nr:hypothetical protein [Kitasatospora purpeofusca]
MSEEQPAEATADEPAVEEKPAPPVAIKASQPVGHQKLETKQITGQVITHTIVKPLPN